MYTYIYRVAWVCKPIIPVLTGVPIQEPGRWKKSKVKRTGCTDDLQELLTFTGTLCDLDIKYQTGGETESPQTCVCVWLLVGYKSSLAKPDKACLIGRIALRGTQQVSVAPGYGVFFHVQWHSCAILTRRIAVAWMLAAWWPFVSPKRGCPAPWRRSPNGLQ